ncbi:MAG TPA: hypothetical protein ENK80_03335, partial [Rhodobacterales bacterium]|nr:hypothetical protein [Rhodobacterales bacterium]
MIQVVRLSRAAVALGLSAALLAACTVNDLGETPPPMGRFLLGHNIAVVADDIEMAPLSRTLSNEAWVSTVRKAVNDRFSRYDGDQYYHISTAVLGYMLAPPGIPVVAAPKSILMADVHIYRDSDGGKPVNAEPKRFTVFEEGGDVIVGSGLTRTAEQQAESLAKNLAKAIQ